MKKQKLRKPVAKAVIADAPITLSGRMLGDAISRLVYEELRGIATCDICLLPDDELTVDIPRLAEAIRTVAATPDLRVPVLLSFGSSGGAVSVSVVSRHPLKEVDLGERALTQLRLMGLDPVCENGAVSFRMPIAHPKLIKVYASSEDEVFILLIRAFYS